MAPFQGEAVPSHLSPSCADNSLDDLEGTVSLFSNGHVALPISKPGLPLLPLYF